jgi:hypothetical protein
VSKHRAVHVRARRGGALVLGGAAALGLLVPSAGTSFAAGANRYDCDDFTYQEEAQAVYDQDRSDPNRLDGGGEPGVACESLPHRPTGSSTTGTTSASSKPASSSQSSQSSKPSSSSHAASSSSAGTSSHPSRHTTSATDRDCDDFDSQQDAQDALDAAPGDPERLDADDDGVADAGRQRLAALLVLALGDLRRQRRRGDEREGEGEGERSTEHERSPGRRNGRVRAPLRGEHVGSFRTSGRGPP